MKQGNGVKGETVRGMDSAKQDSMDEGLKCIIVF